MSQPQQAGFFCVSRKSQPCQVPYQESHYRENHYHKWEGKSLHIGRNTLAIVRVYVILHSSDGGNKMKIRINDGSFTDSREYVELVVDYGFLADVRDNTFPSQYLSASVHTICLLLLAGF